MRARPHRGVALAAALLLFLTVPVTAESLVEEASEPLQGALDDVAGAPGPDPDDPPAPATDVPELIADAWNADDEGGDGAAGGDGDERLGERLRAAFADEMWLAGAAGTAASLLGVLGFALVTRYISPKEALKNPQRAMLYGFIRATPGAHLKQLSEEFNMKTSSILWHVRKLESADLVKSERANGFRVFYPVEGGIEAKKLSRAITALQNENARAIHDLIERRPGLPVKEAAERLDVHPGTVRWHLRKLREFGCVEELVRDDGSLFYPTPLGKKAMEALLGTPTTGPVRNGNAVPTK